LKIKLICHQKIFMRLAVEKVFKVSIHNLLTIKKIIELLEKYLTILKKLLNKNIKTSKIIIKHNLLKDNHPPLNQ
jgi:hypothetical protein